MKRIHAGLCCVTQLPQPSIFWSKNENKLAFDCEKLYKNRTEGTKTSDWEIQLTLNLEGVLGVSSPKHHFFYCISDLH